MRKAICYAMATVGLAVALGDSAVGDGQQAALEYCTPAGGPLGAVTDAEHTVLLGDQPLPPGVRRSRESVDGVSTPVLQAGPATATEAVVFVHGNPGSSRDFDQLIAAASGVARTIAFDMPGFGHADKGFGGTYTTAAAARFVNDMVAHLGVTRVHLVLHDLGGIWALAWAAAHTERLASVALIDTGVLTGYVPHPTALIYAAPVLGEFDMATTTRPTFHAFLEAQNPRPLPSSFLDRMYDDFDRHTRCAVLGYYRDTVTLSGPAQFAAEQQTFSRLKLPALVIWGQRDPYIPASQADNQKNSFPAAEVHVLPNTGHWPFVDEPTVTRSLLVSFLRRAVPQTEQGMPKRSTASAPNQAARIRRRRSRSHLAHHRRARRSGHHGRRR
jgi:pimeloyl-ACP methyl ester carboxylesterase